MIYFKITILARNLSGRVLWGRVPAGFFLKVVFDHTGKIRYSNHPNRLLANIRKGFWG